MPLYLALSDLVSPERNALQPGDIFQDATQHLNRRPLRLLVGTPKGTNPPIPIDTSGKDAFIFQPESANSDRRAIKHKFDNVRVKVGTERPSEDLWKAGSLLVSPDGAYILLRQNSYSGERYWYLSMRDWLVYGDEPSHHTRFSDWQLVSCGHHGDSVIWTVGETPP